MEPTSASMRYVCHYIARFHQRRRINRQPLHHFDTLRGFERRDQSLPVETDDVD
jgi:uncharacterized MAPEG superfamily protein